MSEEVVKLKQDLFVLEAMASEMDEYLKSQVLFWPMSQANLPRLTLGGYLMRQHRLLTLGHLLNNEEIARRDAAVVQFDQALDEKVVRFEERSHQECQARLRQWGEYLKELDDRNQAVADFYHSHVQSRAMIAALIAKLKRPPYEFDERVETHLATYDQVLKNYWVPGEFTWTDGWQPAYPKSEYWWLYGRPRDQGQ